MSIRYLTTLSLLLFALGGPQAGIAQAAPPPPPNSTAATATSLKARRRRATSKSRQAGWRWKRPATPT